MITRTCEHCGKDFRTIPSRINEGRGRFCSKACAKLGKPKSEEHKAKIAAAIKGYKPKPEAIAKWHEATKGKFDGANNPMYGVSGPDAPGWLGGISFEPYCPAFNDKLKDEVRDRFGRRCFLGGKIENGRRLSIHHCDYNKSQGCSGRRWCLIPLAIDWHARTNHNRWYWFALLRDYWVYKYLRFHGMDIFDGPSRTEWLWEIYNS